MPRGHHSIREGAALGSLIATVIWCWLAIVDALAGQPFHTFTVLGGVLTFTLVHYGLSVAYGVAAVAVVHAGAHEPDLLVAVMLGFFVVEFAFVMLTLLLSHVGFGALAWVGIFGGNLIGAAVGWSILLRTHPVREELHAADAEENE